MPKKFFQKDDWLSFIHFKMKKKSSRPPSRKESSKKISKKVEEIPPEPIEEPKPKDFNNLEFVQNCLNISKPEELSKYVAITWGLIY